MEPLVCIISRSGEGVTHTYTPIVNIAHQDITAIAKDYIKSVGYKRIYRICRISLLLTGAGVDKRRSLVEVDFFLLEETAVSQTLRVEGECKECTGAKKAP